LCRRRAIEFEDGGVDNCNVADAEGSAKRVITKLPDFFRKSAGSSGDIQVFLHNLQQSRHDTLWLSDWIFVSLALPI
jgi:hypothetical protein